MLHIDEIAPTEIDTRGGWAVLALLAAVTGCSDDPVSLGGAVAVDRSALSSYAAVWEGYAEAYTFASGSDRVRIALDENGQGAIIFGDATPRPMPTDPDDPFPDLTLHELDSLQYDRFNEGYSYEIAEASVEEERLRIRTGPTNVYVQAACALQTPVLVEDDWYSCVPGNSWGEIDGGCFVTHDATASVMDVPCGKLKLCRDAFACECTSTECFAREPGEVVNLDGALDAAGTRLVGSLAISGSVSGFTSTVRLTRQP